MRPRAIKVRLAIPVAFGLTKSLSVSNLQDRNFVPEFAVGRAIELRDYSDSCFLELIL